MELEKCKFCGCDAFSSGCKLVTVKAWCVECEHDEDQEKFPFAEHRITVYGADQREAEKRWNEVNKI